MHAASGGGDPFDLTGTVVWVVGGSGLLGAPVSEALAARGAHVVVAGRDPDAADAAAARIQKAGGKASALATDAGDAPSIDSAANTIVREHGRLDACVNLSFGSSGRSWDDATPEDWDAALRVTVTGAFLIARAAARVMADGGSIVQFGSMYGQVSPDPAAYPDGVGINPPEYGAGKAAVLQLVRYQAVQLGPRGIRVNAVVPGPFPDDGARARRGFEERLAARVPLGRIGRPDEIAGAVVYLCSSASTYVTGTSIVVDGGWTAW